MFSADILVFPNATSETLIGSKKFFLSRAIRNHHQINLYHSSLLVYHRIYRKFYSINTVKVNSCVNFRKKKQKGQCFYICRKFSFIYFDKCDVKIESIGRL